ncbi:hypothetical protein BaRGS_00005137 [Batillaria attramentaria]|uniref:SLC26A/SulP transporter domain-containing protein n=1 Tax=Batillaria attramentaria TaxID=370345 RepID=A0ABD0LWV9_9CAEN
MAELAPCPFPSVDPRSDQTQSRHYIDQHLYGASSTAIGAFVSSVLASPPVGTVYPSLIYGSQAARAKEAYWGTGCHLFVLV